MKGRPSIALSDSNCAWWLKWLEPPRRERRPHLMLAVGPPPFTDRLWDVFALACKGELMKPGRSASQSRTLWPVCLWDWDGVVVRGTADSKKIVYLFALFAFLRMRYSVTLKSQS